MKLKFENCLIICVCNACSLLCYHKCPIDAFRNISHKSSQHIPEYLMAWDLYLGISKFCSFFFGLQMVDKYLYINFSVYSSIGRHMSWEGEICEDESLGLDVGSVHPSFWVKQWRLLKALGLPTPQWYFWEDFSGNRLL